MKNLAIAFGVIFICLAFFTLVPNALIGKGAFFDTNLLHNLFFFFTGVVLVAVAFYVETWIPKVFRILGAVYLALAVIGSWASGFQSLDVFESFRVNGPDHFLHLCFGLCFIVIGTRAIRFPEDTIEEIREEHEDNVHAETHNLDHH